MHIQLAHTINYLKKKLAHSRNSVKKNYKHYLQQFNFKLNAFYSLIEKQ